MVWRTKISALLAPASALLRFLPSSPISVYPRPSVVQQFPQEFACRASKSMIHSPPLERPNRKSRAPALINPFARLRLLP